MINKKVKENRNEMEALLTKKKVATKNKYSDHENMCYSWSICVKTYAYYCTVYIKLQIECEGMTLNRSTFMWGLYQVHI